MSITDQLFSGPVFDYFVLPFLIFIARILDVSIGTIRIVMISKGQKFWAPVLGFFEILIWLLAIARIFENLDNWLCYFGYAAGFASGNYIGLKIEEKLAMGIVKIQVITRKNAQLLIQNLKLAGYGITHLDAMGATEEVSIIYSIVKRTQLPSVIELIKKYNPNAFYSVEDVRSVSNGVFHISHQMRPWQKGK
ncbi:MAG TPA: DUF2179 domain-containing protein [Prolixibacteraceae bacterium]|nr:DUF2179 domain-containing protein [Prolixibacteraceae bacterium]